LAGPGASGRFDPLDTSRIIVSVAKEGLSLSAGSFPAGGATVLERQDLVSWSKGRLLTITEPGRAHLRRRAPLPGVTQFRAQHDPMREAVIPAKEGAPERVRLNAEESPLDWLRRRKNRDGEPMIDEASYEAGERLRKEVTTAGMLPGISARWGEAKVDGASGPGEATDRMVAARQRVTHAFNAVGPDFADLLLDLCGFLKGLEQIERDRGWPARSAKIVVKLALARLANHYGLSPMAHGPRASRGVRTWKAVVIEGGKA
jgi:hypothetical protein